MNRGNFLKSLSVLLLSPKLLSEIKTYDPSDYYVDNTRGYKWSSKSVYNNNELCYYEYGEPMRFYYRERTIRIGEPNKTYTINQ